jgi:hypothetical protein
MRRAAKKDKENKQILEEFSWRKKGQRWTQDEERCFVQGLAQFGRDWKMVRTLVPSRTEEQIQKRHAAQTCNGLTGGLALEPDGPSGINGHPSTVDLSSGSSVQDAGPPEDIEEPAVEGDWFARFFGLEFCNKTGELCGIIGYNKVSKLFICVDDTLQFEIGLDDLKELHRLEVAATFQTPVQMPAAEVPASSPTLSDEYIAAKLTELTKSAYAHEKFDSVG